MTVKEGPGVKGVFGLAGCALLALFAAASYHINENKGQAPENGNGPDQSLYRLGTPSPFPR